MALRVVAVPRDALTETNCVFVNPNEKAGKLTTLIVHNQVPFKLGTDAGVEVGTIAMNMIQRKSSGVTTNGDTIDIAMASIPVPKDMIALCELDVSFLSASKKGGGTLDWVEFSTYFLNKFADQPFTEGQSLAVVVDSAQKYLARISKIETIRPGDTAIAATSAAIGMLHRETKLRITVPEKSEIQITNRPAEEIDATQSTVVNKFNLEKLGIGGLRAEFAQIFRRAFASRIYPRSLVLRAGIKHVKGVLLYGPPGTGKTLVARKIGEILNCKVPKVVSGPELFDKFVGGTEANVRKLFAEAEEDQKTKGDNSQLHVIIFDEFDAMCKQRGATRDGTGVNDNVVNQLLSKIDGVNALNNVLLIGMTNRIDLLDTAMLRPGRFEVQIEIGLPDRNGRREILGIHTRAMAEAKILGEDVDLDHFADITKNFSGAEIEGLVKAAVSYAFSRHIDFDNPTETKDAADLHVMQKDFQAAMADVTPSFGKAKDEGRSMMRNGIIPYGPVWNHIDREIDRLIKQFSASPKLCLLSVLVEGVVGSGKSAIAAHIANKSGFPYVKFISSDGFVGYGEMQKCNIIRQAFEDAYKSKLSVIVLDDIERLIEFSSLGGRYSNTLLQTLLVLTKRVPPEGRKLLVIGTTSQLDTLDSLEVAGCFSVKLGVPTVDSSSLATIARGLGVFPASPDTFEQCVPALTENIPMKKLILLIEMAAEPDPKDPSHRVLSYTSFSQAALAAGI